MKTTAVEFLVHMSLAAAVASVNTLAEDGLMDGNAGNRRQLMMNHHNNMSSSASIIPPAISHSEHVPSSSSMIANTMMMNNATIRHQRMERVSVTGAQLDLQWKQLHNVEYLTDGGNSWIHTAVFNGKPVVVKTLKPECQDVALAMHEIEGELST